MRVSKQFSMWVKGCNSLLHPSELPESSYAWGENVVNRGGIIQTRAGYKRIASIPGTKLQGFCIFAPRGSTARCVAAVDGKIYAAKYPTYDFKEISKELKFSATAPIVVFEECLQSANRKKDGSIELISPTPILMIGDGESRMGYWDGSNAKMMIEAAPERQAPVGGLWMKWSGDALWVSVGSVVKTSDLANPLSFYDNKYLAGRSNFSLPGPCTGMVETSDQKSLLVFTKNTTTAFQSHIRDRTAWASTPEFQKTLFPEIGCVAGKTACNQWGMTFWLSEAGLMDLNAALNSLQSSEMQTIDHEMTRSKRNMAPDMSRACAASYENMMLVSVPSGGKHNEQTWVLDQPSTAETGSRNWVGVWTGTRPVEWAAGTIGGRKRLMFASYDKTSVDDTHIHIWEAFDDSREDNDGPISCQWQTSIVEAEKIMRFKYAEIEVTELLGRAELDVFVCGTRGKWHPVASFTMRAAKGSIGSSVQQVLTLDSVLQAFRPQSRTKKTQEFNPQGKESSAELSGWVPGIDKGFCLLFEWRGRMGIREFTMVMEDAPEYQKGRCEADETTGAMVNEAGEIVS